VTGTAVALLYLSLVPPSLGEVSTEMVQGVEDAAEQLRSRFQEIRTDILGADVIAAEYKKVGFGYTPLKITDFLSSDVASGHIDTVLGLMPDVSANTTTSSDCCTGPARSEVCCHGCSSASDNILFSAFAEAISSAPSLEGVGVELEFGHVNGTLLRYPTPQPPANCPEDSNLQPWYMNMIRNRPLEIVLLIDLSDFFTIKTNTDGLRAAATAVLKSLTTQDRVQAIVFAKSVLIHESGSNKVVPVCPSFVQELTSFISAALPAVDRGTPAAYVDAFTTAFNTLNNNTDTDKLILFFTSGSNFFAPTDDTTYFNHVITGVGHLNMLMMNRVVISAYYNDAFALPGNEDRINGVVTDTGSLTELNSANDVRNYYDVFNPVATTGDVTARLVGRDVNSRGDASLSLSVALAPGGFVGIFHALLPWNVLFPDIDSLKSGRGHSHFFVMNSEGHILYHPLVPGNFQSDVLVASIESEDVLDQLIASSSSKTPFVVATTKTVLTAVPIRIDGSEERNSFISRSVNMTYTCQPLPTDAVSLYACVAVAAEDQVTAELRSVDTESIDPERRPLYHTSEIPQEDQCFYFCSISTTDKLSVQLTTPSKPPEDASLTDINNVINGSSSAPWAVEGVANELGVVSVVADTWRSNGSTVSDYVVRRHLATPSGLYLTLPFARLSPDFVAPLAEWFILSSAHPHTLTLTPPRLDALREGGHVVSAGVAVSTPPQEEGGNEGGLLAVVAADLTVHSLRVLLEDSLPLCKQNGYNCFLLDDQGHILYHDLLLTSPFQDELEDPIFLVRPKGIPRIVELHEVLTSALNESLAFKMRCIDYLDQNVRQRLFFSFDIGNNEVHAVSSNGLEFVIRTIPGTNVFLGIVRHTLERMIEPFCFCSQSCLTCEGDESQGCECPCECPEDCMTPHSFPACPVSSLESDQLARDSTAAISAVRSDGNFPPFCSPLYCPCKTDPYDCDASRDCHWCSQQSTCRRVSECCDRDDGLTCCTQSPFTLLPNCMSSVCRADISPTTDCPTDPPIVTGPASVSCVMLNTILLC
jgi:hypothetical protein